MGNNWKIHARMALHARYQAGKITIADVGLLESVFWRAPSSGLAPMTLKRLMVSLSIAEPVSPAARDFLRDLFAAGGYQYRVGPPEQIRIEPSPPPVERKRRQTRSTAKTVEEGFHPSHQDWQEPAWSASETEERRKKGKEAIAALLAGLPQRLP